MKWLLTWGINIAAVAVVLSIFVGVPYIYTLIGFAAWVFFGHLITLDDDGYGGFSNPDDSQRVYRRSLKELGLKFLALAALGTAVVLFPVLQEVGAR